MNVCLPRSELLKQSIAERAMGPTFSHSIEPQTHAGVRVTALECLDFVRAYTYGTYCVHTVRMDRANEP